AHALLIIHKLKVVPHRDGPSLFPYTRSSDLLDIAAGRPSAALARLRQRGGLASADEVDALTALLPAIMLAHAGSTTTLYAPRDSDRKSTRLNSSHVKSSYAVFCLKN